MRLLNIESSPRGSSSASSAVTSAFLEAYRQACPGVVVDTLNVWEEKLPDFDQEAIGAKYKGVYKQPMDQAETAVWDKDPGAGSALPASRPHRARRANVELCLPLQAQAADRSGLSAEHAFTYDGNEYGPLLKTPRAMVIYARGGTYAEDSPTPASRFDHQRGYIEFWLKFIGVTEVRTLVVEGTTWRGTEKGEESIARGRAAASELAADF
jgi:FMN-dependent NADH-azoreductase